MNLKLNIAYNKSTQQLIGYSNPKNGEAIVVTAYDVDDLEKKFKKAIEAKKKVKTDISNYDKNLKHFYIDRDQNEVDLMVQTTRNMIRREADMMNKKKGS